MSQSNERVPICIVGCGGMGHRHTIAYHVLEETGLSNMELMAVCDINRDNAERVAGEVERLFGRRPLVFTDPERMLAHPDIAAVDVVTDGSSHHEVATAALAAGKHAQVEKPLGITIRACRRIIDAAAQSGTVLATAENYRRDPVNRMVRAVIDAGLLGDPFLMIQTSLGGGDRMAATPWRHRKEKGAIGLDMGVHYADIIRYYLGEYRRIFGLGLIVGAGAAAASGRRAPADLLPGADADLPGNNRSDGGGLDPGAVCDGVGGDCAVQPRRRRQGKQTV